MNGTGEALIGSRTDNSDAGVTNLLFRTQVCCFFSSSLSAEIEYFPVVTLNFDLWHDLDLGMWPNRMSQQYHCAKYLGQKSFFPQLSRELSDTRTQLTDYTSRTTN